MAILNEEQLRKLSEDFKNSSYNLEEFIDFNSILKAESGLSINVFGKDYNFYGTIADKMKEECEEGISDVEFLDKFIDEFEKQDVNFIGGDDNIRIDETLRIIFKDGSAILFEKGILNAGYKKLYINPYKGNNGTQAFDLYSRIKFLPNGEMDAKKIANDFLNRKTNMEENFIKKNKEKISDSIKDIKNIQKEAKFSLLGKEKIFSGDKAKEMLDTYGYFMTDYSFLKKYDKDFFGEKPMFAVLDRSEFNNNMSLEDKLRVWQKFIIGFKDGSAIGVEISVLGNSLDNVYIILGGPKSMAEDWLPVWKEQKNWDMDVKNMEEEIKGHVLSEKQPVNESDKCEEIKEEGSPEIVHPVNAPYPQINKELDFHPYIPKNHKFISESTKKMIAKLDEIYEDPSDDLGIYTDYEEDETFGGEAEKQAKADIGGEFIPTEPREEEELKKNLRLAKLDLPSEKKKLNTLGKKMNDRKAYEKQFGKGSLNEDIMNEVEDSKGNKIGLNNIFTYNPTGESAIVQRFIEDKNGKLKVKAHFFLNHGYEKKNDKDFLVDPSEITLKKKYLK